MKDSLRTKNNRKRIVAALLCFLLCLSGCASGTRKNGGQELSSLDIFAMDTYMTVSAYGPEGVKGTENAVEEIRRLDELFSTGNENSSVSKVNREGGGLLGEDEAYLVERSLEISEMTDGLFDIAIYPVMKAWGFTDQNYHVPARGELKDLLVLADSDKLSYDKETKTITYEMEGMEIDLGGIAKGYTSSRIMEIYRECGITSGLVSLGGNIQVLGKKPDGSNWKVAIKDPDPKKDYLGVIQIADKAVITSGGYERYFEEGGITYHHIIDPQTGYPADSGLISVTIVSGDGTLADGLSTSLFIMGKEKAVSFWKEHREDFDFILMDDSEKLYVSEGIADTFSSDAYKIEVIK